MPPRRRRIDSVPARRGAGVRTAVKRGQDRRDHAMGGAPERSDPVCRGGGPRPVTQGDHGDVFGRVKAEIAAQSVQRGHGEPFIGHA